MLRFSGAMSEAELRNAVLECGRICYERRLVTSNDGNMSVRLDDGRALITAAGVCKGRMIATDLVLVDLEGKVLHADGGMRPSSELPMHLEVYRNRATTRAVIHAHPVCATALTVAGLEFPADVLPESILALGEVPVTAYATPSSEEDAEAIRPLIRDHAAILLRQHGTLTVGADLEEALLRLERLEHVAEVFWRAQMLGRVNRLTPAARKLLVGIRENGLGE
jgi:L-fuculose-phosphate aldolase